MLHHDFRRLLDALDNLNPAQIEDAQTKIRDLRRKTEAISEIEARTNREHKCPFCCDERRQKWGRTRTRVQRYRCSGCEKTYSGRTGSTIGRIHRPDLFMEALMDMLGSPAPQSVRKLAKQLDLNKYTIWRWRMLVFSIIGSSSVAATFAGIIEADETYQRESRKGSREWVRHFADPKNIPKPPRPRWEDFTTQGLKMMRGLSRWQLPILTVADRGGSRLFRRLPNRKSATVERAMNPPRAGRCRALLGWWQWLQGSRGGARPGAFRGREQARNPCRVRLLSHPERELAPRSLWQVHRAVLWAGDEEPQRLHPMAGSAAGGNESRRYYSTVVKGGRAFRWPRDFRAVSCGTTSSVSNLWRSFRCHFAPSIRPSFRAAKPPSSQRSFTP
ncbi:hypothetical protein PAA8504_03761 [Palleronia abyssalis]|uniref:Transposase zinc-ribbon domain-containing protein n=1 Tax=Palleronia abyssalis TaxID=1501240 RepID=A0A2R8C0I5_9RHOB|nr:hypothetical protein PAA8504_03761 [Palleronia abyssalis]